MKFFTSTLLLWLIFAPMVGAQSTTFNNLAELEVAAGIDLPDDFDYQNFDPPPNFLAGEQTKIPNTVNCFDYYTFGSVDIDITHTTDTALAGIPASFKVTLTNKNPYPLVDGALYVKIYRAQDDITDTTINGDHIIDEFYVLSDVALAADEAKTHTFTWTPPAYLPSGKYYVAGYFNTAERFNLAGLTFTDDVIGGKGEFTVVGDSAPLYFEKDSVKVDGKPHQFIAAAPVVDGEAPIVVTATIRNEANEDRVAMVSWDIYSWDALSEQSRLETREEAVLVPAKGRATISHTVTENRFAVYLVSPSLSFNNEPISQLDIRFVRPQKDYLRINFPSVTSFPLTAGQETTIFSCLHNGGTAPVVPGSELTLTLTDDRGEVIHSYRYQGPTTGEMMGVASNFVPERNYNDVTLTAELRHNGAVVDQVSFRYDCQLIDERQCVPEAYPADTSTTDPRLWQYMFYLILAFVAVAIGIVIRVVLQKPAGIEPAPADDVTNQSQG